MHLILLLQIIYKPPGIYFLEKVLKMSNSEFKVFSSPERFCRYLFNPWFLVSRSFMERLVSIFYWYELDFELNVTVQSANQNRIITDFNLDFSYK